MDFNRSVAAALAAVALTWFVPMGAAHAQTVSMGGPGDHWASMLQYTFIGRGERNGVYGYEVKLRAADGCEATLFYPRAAIDYPSRLNTRSLPNVHPGVLEVEDHYQRQADGAIAAARGFGAVATLGTLTPLPRAVPLPRATRPSPAPARRAPRASSTRVPPRTAPARATAAGTRSAARGGASFGSASVGAAERLLNLGGGVKVGAATFHARIKPAILKAAGRFRGKVGKNPDIKVVGGRIHLQGVGPFKGKTFKTDLRASDFFRVD